MTAGGTRGPRGCRPPSGAGCEPVGYAGMSGRRPCIGSVARRSQPTNPASRTRPPAREPRTSPPAQPAGPDQRPPQGEHRGRDEKDVRISPAALALLTAAAPPHKRGTVVGIYAAVMGLAVVGGPLVGGAVTQGLAWQWIFWINVPADALEDAGGDQQSDVRSQGACGRG